MMVSLSPIRRGPNLYFAIILKVKEDWFVHAKSMENNELDNTLLSGNVLHFRRKDLFKIQEPARSNN